MTRHAAVDISETHPETLSGLFRGLFCERHYLYHMAMGGGDRWLEFSGVGVCDVRDCGRAAQYREVRHTEAELMQSHGADGVKST